MRMLDRTRLLQSPDHTVLGRPWDLDVIELHCSWHGGNDGLCVDVTFSKPMGIEVIGLRFTGAFDVRLDGFRPLVGCRILDATRFLPEIPAPICVLPHQWERTEADPCFWAQSVERRPV